MKKVLFFLTSLLTTQAYAVCGVTYPERDYQLDSGRNDFNMRTSSSYTIPFVGNNIVNNCQIGSIFINAYADFSINSQALSNSSPFQLTDHIDFLNPNATAEDIVATKEFLKNNLTLTFSLQDNTNINTAKPILSSGIEYNLIPETTAYPSNIILVGDRYYYNGQEQNGVRSLGIRFVNPIISIQDRSFLQPSVIRGLNGGRLNINTGKLIIRYFYTNDSSIIYTQETDLLLSIGFQASAPTCQIDVPNQLNLGSTTVSLLNNNTQNRTNFNMNIICATAMPLTQFQLKLMDANDFTNVNSEGMLTNAANAILKSNATIQLINVLNNEPFEIGSSFSYIGTDANETRTVIPNSVAAQIVKSEESVTVGQIESKVTFFLDYE